MHIRTNIEQEKCLRFRVLRFRFHIGIMFRSCERKNSQTLQFSNFQTNPFFTNPFLLFVKYENTRPFIQIG